MNTDGERSKFWAVLKVLMEIEQPMKFSEISKELSIPPRHLNTYLNFLKEVQFNFEVDISDSGEKVFKPKENKQQINLNFNLFEWLEFQAHFPFLAQACDEPFHNQLKEKIATLENQFSEHDLFAPYAAMEEIMNQTKPKLAESNSHIQNEMISFIEESILEQQPLSISVESKNISLYPESLIYLEGDLCVVGENILDKSLLNIPLGHINHISEEEGSYIPTHNKIAINDFILSIRAITEQETRLVLKINGLTSFENSIPRNFLGSPAMITNPEGDLIWAATVESNIEIFNWLHNLGSDVEILDPVDFKKEYLSYCESLLKKLA